MSISNTPDPPEQLQSQLIERAVSQLSPAQSANQLQSTSLLNTSDSTESDFSPSGPAVSLKKHRFIVVDHKPVDGRTNSVQTSAQRNGIEASTEGYCRNGSNKASKNLGHQADTAVSRKV